MSVSAFWLKWGLRFYPPLFFQRIWVRHIGSDFKSAQVKIYHSLFNRNYNGSIFGGTLFTATDPFYPALFYQIFLKKGYKVVVWSKSAQIHFLKPGNTNLTFNVLIRDSDIAAAEFIINNEGKYSGHFTIDIYNKDNEVCVTVINEVYIRNLNFIDKQY